MHTVLALDIGGTKIAGGIIDDTGQILLADKIPTPTAEGGPAILKQAATLLLSLQSHFSGPDPSAIGISTGGQIDSSGQIIGGTDMIPDWVGLPLRTSIEKQFGLPTALLNDGQAAALGESHIGAGRNHVSMLCVVIGTGLGGGLVVGGQLQHGSHGLAGSVGQMKVSPDGHSFIPLEDIVSGPGLLRSYNDRIGTSEAAADGREVALRAQAGDEIAAKTIHDMGWWLGLGLSHALHAYDAECVVVGGSVALIGQPLIESARSSLGQHGHMTVAETPILPAELGPQAQLVGAAEFARQQVEQ